MASTLRFPPTRQALLEPNGLLAMGGDLSVASLLAAYRRGIFPWFEEPGPILWWTPDPRTVLWPDGLHIARSLRRSLRRDTFRLRVDHDFAGVMEACAGSRRSGTGTWIGQRMRQAYGAMHGAGHAHSVEIYTDDDRLVGGLYGVSIGRVFFGESMFAQVTDASKVALVGLMSILRRGGYALVDCQTQSAHLVSLGAVELSRLDFEAALAENVDVSPRADAWCLPERCGALL